MKHALVRHRSTGRFHVVAYETDDFGFHLQVAREDVHDVFIRQVEEAIAARRLEALAVGPTMPAAVAALAMAKGLGEVNVLHEMCFDEEEERRFTWGVHFKDDTDATYRCAGRAVPGGFTVTWWE